MADPAAAQRRAPVRLHAGAAALRETGAAARLRRRRRAPGGREPVRRRRVHHDRVAATALPARRGAVRPGRHRHHRSPVVLRVPQPAAEPRGEGADGADGRRRHEHRRPRRRCSNGSTRPASCRA